MNATTRRLWLIALSVALWRQPAVREPVAA